MLPGIYASAFKLKLKLSGRWLLVVGGILVPGGHGDRRGGMVL